MYICNLNFKSKIKLKIVEMVAFIDGNKYDIVNVFYFIFQIIWYGRMLLVFNNDVRIELFFHLST